VAEKPQPTLSLRPIEEKMYEDRQTRRTCGGSGRSLSAISESPSMQSADQKRHALPVASNEKRAVSIARRGKR
jgi:hypothetical protein